MGKKKKDKCVSKNKNRKEKIPKQKEIKPKKKYSKSQELFLESIHDLSLKDLGVLFNTEKFMRKKK